MGSRAKVIWRRCRNFRAIFEHDVSKKQRITKSRKNPSVCSNNSSTSSASTNEDSRSSRSAYSILQAQYWPFMLRILPPTVGAGPGACASG